MHLPSCADFEYKLAFHCAATLAGIKPANLFSVTLDEWTGAKLWLKSNAKALEMRRIRFYKLAQCDKRVLLLVYNKALFHDCLFHTDSLKLLDRYGYDTQCAKAATLLSKLSKRIRESHGFPHEIGVFLGYPVDDVRGFIENSGKNFCFCGCWKVYSNPARARSIFAAYAHARSYYCAHLMGGKKIHDIQYGGNVS